MGFCPIFGRIRGKMSPWGQNIYSFSENDFGKDRGRRLYFFVYLRPITPPKTFSGKL
jgi:hypothetical protein